MIKIFTTFCALLLLAGCSLAPKLELPAPETPQAEENLTIAKDWWKDFGDNNLNALVDEALEHNFDLLIAASNVAEARAALGLAESQQYPTLGVAGEGSRAWSRNPADTSSIIENDSYRLTGVLSYEVDLWGKMRDNKKAALSALLAMEATQDAVRISLAAGVVESYYSLLAVEQNIISVKTMLESKEESYAIRKWQAEQGALSELLLNQVTADLIGAKVQLVALERQKTAAATALAVLVGRTPKAIFEQVIATDQHFPLASLEGKQLPSDLVLRRADIKAAEESLRAANYSIGAARSAYFPSFTLTGAAGYQSSELGDLIKKPSEIATAGVGINLPLLTFGQIGANVDAAKARKEAAVVRYEQSISKAFSEVYDALLRQEQAVSRRDMLTQQAAALKTVLELTRIQYDAGLNVYTDVIDAEADYLNAKMGLVGAEFENVSAQVGLYKALGGGWENGQGK